MLYFFQYSLLTRRIRSHDFSKTSIHFFRDLIKEHENHIDVLINVSINGIYTF